jgi:hypothetical protein
MHINALMWVITSTQSEEVLTKNNENEVGTEMYCLHKILLNKPF